MAKAQLIYDENCPICTNYIRLIKKKISDDDLDYVPNSDGLDEFRYINADGVMFEGKSAIDELSKDFTEVTQFFWLLPQKYRTTALKIAYTAASTARKALKAVSRGGCGCGKKGK
jgi:hypothetical protein